MCVQAVCTKMRQFFVPGPDSEWSGNSDRFRIDELSDVLRSHSGPRGKRAAPPTTDALRGGRNRPHLHAVYFLFWLKAVTMVITNASNVMISAPKLIINVRASFVSIKASPPL